MTDRLSHEDRILWSRVAETTTPLRGRARRASALFEDIGHQPDVEHTPVLRPAVRAAAPNAAAPVKPPKLDLTTRKKLAKGRLPIEGKVDLHGLTQTEAHTLLLSFLHRAQSDGRRHVLVVTGKGASLGSDGILRRAVPQWLSTPSFRGLVNGHEDAARNHGGEGALYIRVRRGAERSG